MRFFFGSVDSVVNTLFSFFNSFISWSIFLLRILIILFVVAPTIKLFCTTTEELEPIFDTNYYSTIEDTLNTILEIIRYYLSFNYVTDNLFFLFINELLFGFFFLIFILCNSHFVLNFALSQKYKNFSTSKEMIQQYFIILIFTFIFCCLNMGSDCADISGLFISNIGTTFLKMFFLFLVIMSSFSIFQAVELAKLRIFDIIILILGCVLSSMLLFSATHFISIYLCFEFQSICFYTLAGLFRNSIHSSEAGLKYFISNAIVSCFFLLAGLIFYACFGLLDFKQLGLFFLAINTSLSTTPYFLPVVFAICILIAVFGFKLVAAPFHFWQPLVYEGAPLSATIIFSVFPKIVIFTPLFRFCNLFSEVISLEFVFFIFGLFSFMFGIYKAFSATRLKSILIYSSMSQIGLPLSLVGFPDLNSKIAVYFFLIIYSLTSVFVWNFYTELILSQRNEIGLKDKQPIYLSSLSGLWWTNRTLALNLLFIFFSLGGIPPLVGFLGKSYIFSIFINNYYFLGVFVFVCVGCFSVFYYLRVIKILIEEVPVKPQITFKDNKSDFYTIQKKIQGFLLILIVLGLFFPDLVFIFCCEIVLNINF